MNGVAFRFTALLFLLSGYAIAATADLSHPVNKYRFNLPPPADLLYSIKAGQHGFTISGEALINWRVSENKYAITSQTRAILIGKILESSSQGMIDLFGLAPHQFTEKSLRKNQVTTFFNRDTKTISFSESTETYRLIGGEQDRSSAAWQLAAVARGNPEKFVAGSEWTFFVAGRRDAEAWIFRVVKSESIPTVFGDVTALHVSKVPPPDSKDQRLDLWLAPSHEWYPVRLRFSDGGGDFVEQTLEKITRK